MKSVIDKLDELSGEHSFCRIALYAIIDEMLTSILSMTGVPADGGANGIVFPSSLSGGRPRNNADDLHKLA
jgi:hypothetical protein